MGKGSLNRMDMGQARPRKAKMEPHFRTKRKNESLHDFARSILSRCSYRKVNAFSLFDISYDAYMTIMDDIQEFDTAELSVLVDWGKNSVFRMHTTPNPENADTAWYEMGVVVGERSRMVRTSETFRDWGLYTNAGRHIPENSSIDLINYDTEDLKMAAQSAGIVALRTMRGILDRPTEYRLSHGARTSRERVLNRPAVVTISLSKPVIRAAPSGHHSGVKMPEHDVRGHERRLKSGRIVWVTGHKRGDPNVERRTTYRIVP